MPNRRIAWLACCGAVAHAGMATLPAQAVHDSAGTTIVSYPSGARPAVTWGVDPRPLLQIGGALGTGPAELAGVVATYRLSGGGVVVALRPAGELRYFAADGTHRLTAGRKGQGPGEFDGLAEVHRSGDSLAVSDRSGRLQVFGPAGQLLRAYPRPDYPGASVFGWAALLPDGSGVVRALDPPADSAADRITAWMSFARRSPTIERAVFMARFPYLATERMDAAVSAGQRGHTPLWLGPALRTTRSGGRFCAGYGDVWSVRCVDATGRVVVRTERAMPQSPVGAADRERFAAAFRANFRAMPAPQLDMTLRTFRYASMRGQLGRFVGTATGETWVAEFDVEDEVPRSTGELPTPARETRWSVLGPDGRWRGDALLPPRFILMDAGPTWVLGVARDADDVEQVVVHRLVELRRQAP